MKRLLIFEVLHADERLYAQASASLRAEGRAMLLALCADGSSAGQSRTTALVCRSASAELSELPTRISVTIPDEHRPLVDQLPVLVQSFDAVLPVAPETDGLLDQVAATLWQLPVQVLLPHLSFTAMCADKWQTWEQFSARGIPMLPCQLCGPEPSTAVDRLPLFKQRYGAGGEGIRRDQRPSGLELDGLLVQPWIAAASLSVGLLGNGRAICQLPVAVQNIVWESGTPVYRGGSMPGQLAPNVVSQIDRVVDHVVAACGPLAGYLGIDLLLADSDQQIWLNEINPRLCTSYIGYRELVSDNLIEWMLGSNPMSESAVRSLHIDFHSDGTVGVTALPSQSRPATMRLHPSSTEMRGSNAGSTGRPARDS